MKVLLIIGGPSTEKEVSKMSAKNIRKNIRKDYEVKAVGIDIDGAWYELNNDDYTSSLWLDKSIKIIDVLSYLKSFDVVFPIIHGLYGEDGSIQGLLKMAAVPYVGMNILSSSISFDKVYTKFLLNNFNIKQVPFLYIKKKKDKFVVMDDNFEEKENILELVNNKFKYPVFVKASNQGSSVGCYKVNNDDELLDKINKASNYDYKILIEQAINARELECALLGNDEVIASNVGEIITKTDYYTYDSKYNDNSTIINVPAKLNDNIKEQIRTMALKIYKILDGKGMARCDFFLDKDTNEIYFNEINTIPGFTNASMYPMLIKEYGINEKDLIDKLIKLALESHNLN